MKISITGYAPTAFTKYGKLKKKARSEFGFMQVDVEPYTKGATESFIEEVASKLKRDYTGFKSPYVFTHIE